MLAALAGQVGQDLGEPDGVIVFDPSAFAKKGTKSVGVIRQWCGRLGKVENCQVGGGFPKSVRPRSSQPVLRLALAATAA